MTMRVAGGQSKSVDGFMNVEATENIEADIPEGSVPTTVTIAPALAEVQALMITAESYEDLTVAVGMGTPFALDAPMMIVGPGVASALGIDLSTLIFTNANVTTANQVTIFLAREAILPGQ